MKGPRGPFQTSITIHVQNLVVASDPRKLIKWDPEHPELCDTTLSYSLQCAQRKQVTVKIKIYSVEGWQGMELSDTFIYPDKSSDTVDLAPLFGTWQLPKGLYTFDIQVTGIAPYYRDSLRSNAVIIPHVEARLMKIGLTTRAGVINGDYCLCSDRDAKQVFVSFYDPTFDQPMFSPIYPSDYRRPRILHDERLWYYLTKNGNNVTAAVYYAKEDTEGKYGAGKSGDPVRIGDGTTVLYPARWAP